MPKWEITIEARYLVDIDDLHKVREQITEQYTNPELPDFLGEENIEYLDGGITYELIEDKDTKLCVGQDCEEQVDKDIWKEELGMCVECSNAYYTHEEEKGDK